MHLQAASWLHCPARPKSTFSWAAGWAEWPQTAPKFHTKLGTDAGDFLLIVPETSTQGIPGPAAGTRCSHCQGAGSALAGELRRCKPQGGAKGKVKRDEHADGLEDGFFPFDLTGIADC